MADEPFTPSTNGQTAPPSHETHSWGMFLANTALQLAVGLFVGLMTFLLLYVLGSEPVAARGWALIAALIGFWTARSVVRWPVSHPTQDREPTQPDAEVPYRLVVLSFIVQLGAPLGLGMVSAVIMLLVGLNPKSATAFAVTFAIVAFCVLSRFITWPLPRAVAAAKPVLPPNVRASESGGREIVETVVFVVVLVLLLKSFAAEAFVIPTGSMAETLYGYHKWVKCPSCEFEFPVNCSREVDPQDGPPRVTNRCTCPNCRLAIELISEDETDKLRKRLQDPNLPQEERRGIQQEIDRRASALKRKEAVPDPGPSSGDRVLVGKFLYDADLPGTGHPQRLDVVVFKFPGHGEEMKPGDPLKDGPQKKHVAMNYIKRLIGLPGETIVICGGDLYSLSPEKSPIPRDDAKVRDVDRWTAGFMHVNDPEVLELWKKSPQEFEIVRKPPQVMLSTMRIVYDNDHPASDLKGKEYQRWRPDGETWEVLQEGKAFRFDAGSSADAQDWLRYYHVLRGKKGEKGEPSHITDFLGYNADEGGDDGINWVGDLILECDVKIEKAQGELTFELVRSSDQFRATFTLDPAGGSCSLTRTTNGKTEVLKSTPLKLSKGTHKLRFANVDQRLTLWVDNTLPFGDGVTYPALGWTGPTKADLLPVAVGVKGAELTIQRLKVFRDGYYTRTEGVGDRRVIRKDEWPDPAAQTLYVQPGHYLCMGDNSPASSDGRSWGLVPQRLLLGRALLVYYPFSRAGRIR